MSWTKEPGLKREMLGVQKFATTQELECRSLVTERPSKIKLTSICHVYTMCKPFALSERMNISTDLH